MKWIEGKRFHALLVLTERPRELRAWQVTCLLLALAISAGFIGKAVADSVSGWIVALGLLLFNMADWAVLATLPRRNLSHGAFQPPLLGLALLRWSATLATLALSRLWPVSWLPVLAILHALIWGLMAYGTTVEPFRLQVSQLDIRKAKLSNPGTPLRIVQLSDLHVERLTRREHALPSLVAGLGPDLIVLTGDFLNTSYNSDPRALAELRGLLAQLGAPHGIYAVWGSAEVDLPEFLRPVFTELGIVLLEDRALEVKAGSHHLWLMGVSCGHDPAADDSLLHTLLRGAPPGALTVLLHHTPDLMPQAASLGVDLYLAGHTHGGQWRLPGFGAILTSSRYWKRYEAGHYQEGHTDLYVSRGLGMEGFGMPRARLFCPPEVVLISLSGSDTRK